MTSFLSTPLLVAVSTQFLAHPVLSALQSASELAASSLLGAVWQGALLASLVAIGIKLAPRTTAAARFALWSVAFLAVLLLPFLGLFSPLAAAASVQSTSHSPAAPLLQFDARWGLVIGILWLAASLFRASRLAVHIVRLTSLWRSAKPLSAEQYPQLAVATRRFEICTTAKLDRPGVIGFFAPRILIPEWLYAQLSPAELKQVVLHELEHLRRRDDWTNLFQRLSLILFPLNPALYWIERQLCAEREMACDEGVIELTHAPRAYAICLTRLAEHGLHHRSEALSLGVWQRRSELARRVHSILRGQQVIRPRGTQALIAAVACSLAFVAVELSHSPQLVAFVPTQTQDVALASTIEPASFRAAQKQTARKLDFAQAANTSTHPPRRASREGSAGPYLTETRALMPMPAAQGSPIFPRYASTKTARPASPTHEVEAALSTQPTPLQAANRFEAQTQDPQRTQFQAQNQAQTQWIVLTTWEREPLLNDRAERDQPGQATGIITQVVFRIVTRDSAASGTRTPNPAQSSPAQSSPMLRTVAYWPPRSGWLIFQL